MLFTGILFVPSCAYFSLVVLIKVFLVVLNYIIIGNFLCVTKQKKNYFFAVLQLVSKTKKVLNIFNDILFIDQPQNLIESFILVFNAVVIKKKHMHFIFA